MSNNLFELPWDRINIIPEYVLEKAEITEVINRLENLFSQRKKLSCPNDDIDNRILSAIWSAVTNTKCLLEQQNLTNAQKIKLINSSKSLIRKANAVIEKTLKIRFH